MGVATLCYWVEVSDLSSWARLPTGRVLHSHHYRYATPFSSQSVVILGANASGLDISIELAKVGAQVRTKTQTNSFSSCKKCHSATVFNASKMPPTLFFKVILSHRKPRFTFPLPPEVKQSSPVAAVDEDGKIHFQVMKSVFHMSLACCSLFSHHLLFSRMAPWSRPTCSCSAPATTLVFPSWMHLGWAWTFRAIWCLRSTTLWYHQASPHSSSSASARSSAPFPTSTARSAD